MKAQSEACKKSYGKTHAELNTKAQTKRSMGAQTGAQTRAPEKANTLEDANADKPIEIEIRNLMQSDLDCYVFWFHPNREFHQFNGPYYGRKSETELTEFVEYLRRAFLNGEENPYPQKKMIVNRETDELIGQVSWYWKSQETLWLEIGVVIFNENYWGHGIGYRALTLWTEELFTQMPELARLGLTTWSGNFRMMHLAEKLGFVKEAVYRKARIVEGQYYDSISYGILREEWDVIKSSENKRLKV